MLIVLVVGFAGLTARFFVWPTRGMPAHVDAIVMLNGPGDRLDTAVALARAGRAGTLVVSRGSSYWGHGSACAPAIRGVHVICFEPSPSSTRGEAEFAGRLAQQYHWRSIVVITTPDQDTRARIRVGRCVPDRVYVETTALPPHDWPWAVLYEWGATFKALVWQRGC